MASMGLPGFSGFVAELQVLIGSWHAFPTLTVVAGIGILIGVAYTLRALLKAFFPEQEPSTVASAANDHGHASLEPTSVPERVGAVVLLATSLLIGLYPRLLLDLIMGSFGSGSGLFDWLPKGGN
jgi:NADH-quinone oxidoreductase subunit M